MIVRWLGAYRKRSGSTLRDALEWELTGGSGKTPVCATTGTIRRARVGLLVRRRAVVRKWRADVYSIRRRGRLVATVSEGFRRPYYDEVWVRQDYSGIIIRGKISWQALATCREMADKYGLKIIRVKDD